MFDLCTENSDRVVHIFFHTHKECQTILAMQKRLKPHENIVFLWLEVLLHRLRIIIVPCRDFTGVYQKLEWLFCNKNIVFFFPLKKLFSRAMKFGYAFWFTVSWKSFESEIFFNITLNAQKRQQITQRFFRARHKIKFIVIYSFSKTSRSTAIPRYLICNMVFLCYLLQHDVTLFVTVCEV